MTASDKLSELAAVLLTVVGLSLPVGPAIVAWIYLNWPEAVYR